MDAPPFIINILRNKEDVDSKEGMVSLCLSTKHGFVELSGNIGKNVETALPAAV